MYITLIVNCVLNAILACTAIVLNTMTIIALRNIPSLPRKPLKILLLSMSVSDLGVGLVVQPMYIRVLVVIVEIRSPGSRTVFSHILFEWYTVVANFLTYASFFSIVALSADRFLVIRLLLRYQDVVTHKRVIAVVISFWVFGGLLSLPEFKWFPVEWGNGVTAAVEAICLLFAAFFYYKIYSALQVHANSVQPQPLQLSANNAEMIQAEREKKSAIGVFYVYLAFIACYLPLLCVNVAEMIIERTPLTWELSLYATILVALNSSLSPLIYCWKMRRIRRAMIGTFRNILPSCQN